MGFSKLAFSLAIMSVICLSTVHLAKAQNEYLAPHNAARAAVRVPPMRWNLTLANFARRYASQHVRDCRPTPPPGPYGWNIYIGTGTPSAAVASWVSEKPFYRCPSNTCAPGKTCTHYTQVVWSTSTQLGCARMRCRNGKFFTICSYYKRGNVPGKRPYYPCIREEAMEAVEGAMEELVEVAVEEAVEETMEMNKEEVGDVEENAIAQVV